MKLDEITKVVSQPSGGFDLQDFDIEHATQIGTAENIPIVKIQPKDHAHNAVMFALVVDDQIVGVMIGALCTVDGPAFCVERTYTAVSMRNKGLMTALYKALYTKYNIRLVSDLGQSPETISIWKKLAQTLPVKVVDAKNGQLLDFSDVTDQQLYDERLGLRLMLESNTLPEGWHVPPRSSLLTDNINYTAEENNGLYD